MNNNTIVFLSRNVDILFYYIYLNTDNQITKTYFIETVKV